MSPRPLLSFRARRARPARRPRSAGGFTLTELLVVIGVIGVLLAIIAPVLTGVWKGGQLAKSANNMRQIHLWMQAYSGDHRDYIVPAYFDYSPGGGGFGGATASPTKVRSEDPLVGELYEGTWTDILWTLYAVNDIPDVDVAGGPLQSYRFDSPDYHVYDTTPGYVSPFRSAANNTRSARDVGPGDEPVPFGAGASEEGRPGYFAANMSFDSAGVAHSGYYASGEIRAPTRVMYLVDSFYGETIGPRPGGPSTFTDAFWVSGPGLGAEPSYEVDFRYAGDTCLMLFLDGHSSEEGQWTNLQELEDDRSVIVTNVTGN